jgi:chromosome segregation ATPase
LDPKIEDALYDLEDWVEEALEYDEEDYTQESFHDLIEALEYAEVTDYTSTLTRIQKACTKIEEAIENLEEVTGSKEKKVVKAKKALRSCIILMFIFTRFS